jgi:hypothetical protein
MKKILAIFAIGTLVFSIQSCSREDETVLSEVSTNDTKSKSNLVTDSLKFQKNMKAQEIPITWHMAGYVGRYWKSSGNEFVYTTNPNEIPQSFGYSFQVNLGNPSSGNASLTRWYHPSSGDRLLSITNEVAGFSGWINEGQIGYVSTTQQSNNHPIYRYRKYNGGRHLYTRDFNELGGGNSYWIYEGIVFYINS